MCIASGIAILFILAAACAFFYWNQPENQQKKLPKSAPNYTIEKTGAGAHVDFTEKTKQIHQVVDEVLTQNKAVVFDIAQSNKTMRREGAEGDIKWSLRTVQATAKAETIERARADLARYMDKIGAEVLQIEPDTVKGKKALRIDIGVADTVEGETVSIVADQIFLFEQQAILEPSGSKPGTKARLALIIDDFGYAKAPIDAYASIGAPLTFAILPNHPYSKAAAERGYEDGREIILHLPMEALSDQAKPEEYTIKTEMSDGEIRALVNELTNAVPYIVGVNNHQGSKATSNRRVMKTLLRALAEKGLFFVDSKTVGTSIAFDTAKEERVPAAANMLFIDNNNDRAAIREQLKKAGDLALKHGHAVAIGHARVGTAAAIEEMIPVLNAKGVQLTPISSLLE